MFDQTFDSGTANCTHVSGLSYVAVRHPLGLGVDIIQVETGQIVQTIELLGVKEVSWSANSCHLAVLIHINFDEDNEKKLPSKRFYSSQNVEQNITSHDSTVKLKKINEEEISDSSKYEIRLYSCNESGSLVPPEWFMWKTISAPIYSYDCRNSFTYHCMSFSFPLITLSVTMVPLKCTDTENEFPNGHSKNTSSRASEVPEQSKVVLLDVNVCVYDEVLLYLPDSDDDSLGIAARCQVLPLSPAKLSKTGGFLALTVCFIASDTSVSEDDVPRLGRKVEIDSIIPVLCVVDVFLSSHFLPFKGHYVLPNINNNANKGDGEEKKEVETEDCSSFHSVFSEDESEADRYIETPRFLPGNRTSLSSGKAASSTSSKPAVLSSLRVDKSSFNSSVAGDGVTHSWGNSDVEGSVPTYIDIQLNTTITASYLSDYIVGSRVSREGSGVFDAVIDFTTPHATVALCTLAWRKAHPSDLDSSEIFLTLDKASTLKVWSTRRRELAIPVTTATRSISGAGTSCIVTGNFHTHINPDVTLVYETSVYALLRSGSVDECEGYDVPRVDWIEHVTCPASEQRHLSNRSTETSAAVLSASSHQNETAVRGSARSGSKRNASPSPTGTHRASRERVVDTHHSLNSSITSDHDHIHVRDASESGMWLSILAHHNGSFDSPHMDDENDRDTVDGVNVTESTISNSNPCRSRYLQYHFACLNNNTVTQMSQAVIRGCGSVIPIGSSHFPPSAVPQNSFSDIQQSYVVGRFSSTGLGFPFSADIVTIYRDTVDSSLSNGCSDKVTKRMRSASDSCYVKIACGVSEIALDRRHCTSLPVTPSRSTAKTTAAETASPAHAGYTGRWRFTVNPKTSFDILYHNNASNCNTQSNKEGNSNPKESRMSPSLRRVLPFSTDSLAGVAQAKISRFDSHGQVFRVSDPGPSNSSFQVTSRSPPLWNTSVLSRLGLVEQQQQHQPYEAVSYEILPSIPQTYGLIHMSEHSVSPSGGDDEGMEYSVIRAIIVPLSALLNDVSCDDGVEPLRGGSKDNGTQALLVLQSSGEGAMRLLVSTHEMDHAYGDRHVTLSEDHTVDGNDSTQRTSTTSSDAAGERDLESMEESTHSDSLYAVSVSPDLQYGLGLRLDVRDNAIIVDSFKRHPVSDLPLGCEASLLIGLQDELVSINSHSLSGASLPSVIQTIRSVVQNSRGLPVVLVLQKASKTTPAAADVESAQCDFKAERSLLACPYYFWQHCCIIDLKTHCCTSDAERLTAADIGYDAHTNEVIIGTLETRTCGTLTHSSVTKRSVCLYGVHLTLCLNDDVSSSKVSVDLLCSHDLNQSDIGQQCATLQLWRDTPFSPIPTLIPIPVPVPTSFVYASVLLNGRQSDAAPTSGRGVNADMELATCCTLTVVKMRYTNNHNLSTAHAHTQGVENCVRVVTSSLPHFAATTNGTASFGQDSSAQSYRSYGKTQPSLPAVRSPREIQFQLLTCPIRTAGSQLSQRLLLGDPDFPLVLSATMFAGVGALPCDCIADITRHPFTSSTDSERKGDEGAGTGNVRPLLALCTQLLDLRPLKADDNRGDQVTRRSDAGGDACCCCTIIDDNTIQIITRNWTVHRYSLTSDLQCVVQTQDQQIPHPEISGDYFSILKRLVGFGLGRGGSWMKVGYITPGAATCGASPLMLGCVRSPPHAHGGHIKSSATLSAAAFGTAFQSESELEVATIESPIVSVLSLFQALSSLPDMPINYSVAAPKIVPPPSPFSLSSNTFSDTRSARGLGFGFGFGGMTSFKQESPSSTPTSTSSVTADEAVKANGCEVAHIRSAYASALRTRFDSLFQFAASSAADILPVQSKYTAPHDADIILSQETHDTSAAIVALTLDSIDDDFSPTPIHQSNKSPSDVNKVHFFNSLVSLCDHLRPLVRVLACARTAEDAALLLLSFNMSADCSPQNVKYERRRRRGHLGIEDVVLTYVLCELLCRLCALCNINQDGDGAHTTDSSVASKAIATKMVSLDLDESAVNCLLLSMSSNILKETTAENSNVTSDKVEAGQSNGFMDALLRKDGNEMEQDNTPKINLESGSKILPLMGGAEVMNCLVSSSQKSLFDIYVLQAVDRKVEERFGSTQGEDVRVEGLTSISRYVTADSSQGVGTDVLTFLTRTHAALWLVDVTPLGDLIGRMAMQQFKANKDSMDVFLEMVLAGQMDKLLMLAKADRNNTGKQLLSLLTQDLSSENGRNVLRKNAFALMRLTRYKHAAGAFLSANPPMVKEACSILCKQCEDPLLGLLVARIVENQCLAQSGSASRKGYVLGPVSRNIISTYLLPGFLHGVELDSHTVLSRKSREIFEMKSVTALAPSVSLKGSMKEGDSNSSAHRSDLSWQEEKAEKHRQQQLVSSFGSSGVDAVALCVVCALWLQDSGTLQRVFLHCNSLGLFSSALSAQRPLLSQHAYGLLEAFLSSASSYCPPPGVASDDIARPGPHPLSPSAGRVTVERVSDVLSSSALIRWILVAGYEDQATSSEPAISVDAQAAVSAIEFKSYRSRNLNLDSTQIQTALLSVKMFLTEFGVSELHRNILIMQHAALKKKMYDSLRLRGKSAEANDDVTRNKHENDFKKACRVVHAAWKIARDAQRKKEKELAQNVVVPTQSRIPSQPFDIFDQPVSRVRVSTSASASASDATKTVPVSAPVPAFDIFDQPVSRVRVSTSASASASDATKTVPVSAPVPAFDIFDQPVSRVRVSTSASASASDATKTVPVSAPVPAFDIFDQPVSRVRVSTSASASASDATKTVPVSAPVPAFDIFDQPVSRVRVSASASASASDATKTVPVSAPVPAFDIFDQPVSRVRVSASASASASDATKTVPVSAPVPAFDIFDQPVSRVRVSTSASASASDATKTVPVSAPVPAFDIFDQPVSRVRVSASASASASDATKTVPVSAPVPAFDIFDQPVSRVRVSTSASASASDATKTVPVSAPVPAFDIFDQPVSRVRVSTSASASASDATKTVPVSAPVPAFDIFDQPVSRVRVSASASASASDATKTVPVSAPVPAFDIFDQPVSRVRVSASASASASFLAPSKGAESATPLDVCQTENLDEDVVLAMRKLNKLTSTGLHSDIMTVGDAEKLSATSDASQSALIPPTDINLKS